MTNIASPWKRLLAIAVDQMMIITIGLLMFSRVVSSSDLTVILDNLLYLFAFLVFGSLFVGMINIVLTSVYGGSIGKLLTGLRVVDSENRKISFWKAVFRNYIGYFVSGTLVWLGFLWAFKDKERRAWHDMIADTHVVTTGNFGLVSGLLTLLGLAGVCGYLTMLIFGNILINIPFYTEVFSEIKIELMPTPTTQPPLPSDFQE